MPHSETRTVELDARGFVCPSSLLVALRELNKHKDLLRNGCLNLRIFVDNHDSANRICEAVRNMGYQFEITGIDSSFCICISRTNDPRDERSVL